MMGLTPLIFLALGFPPSVETQTFELKFCEPPTPELFLRARLSPFRFKVELGLDQSGAVRSVQRSITNPIRDIVETPEECFLSWRFPFGGSRPTKATVFTHWNSDGGWWQQSVQFGEIVIRLILTEPGYVKHRGVNRSEYLRRLHREAKRHYLNSETTSKSIAKTETQSFELEFCRPSAPLFSPRRSPATFQFQTELLLEPSGKVQLVRTPKQEFADIIETPEECFSNWRVPFGELQPDRHPAEGSVNATVTTDWHSDGGWKFQSIHFGKVIIRLRPHESELLKEYRGK